MNDYARAAKTWAPLAILIVVADQLTKQWALDALDDGNIIEVLGQSRFELGFNTGMAFSQGEGLGPIIGVVALVVIGGLVASVSRQGNRVMRVAAGLIIGGAIGNVLDRVFRDPGWFRGAVVDFIRVFDWFPIFNVADIGITVGGVLMVGGAWWMNRNEPAAADER